MSSSKSGKPAKSGKVSGSPASDEIYDLPLRKRLPMLAILAMFMIPFGAVAIIFGALPIADAVSTVWRASSLKEVTATVKEVRLDQGTRVGTRNLRSLNASYRYDWNGKTYESSRISVQHWTGWSDRASWHQEWFEKLEDARKTGKTVSAWVNPDTPAEAVLDKELRWARLLLGVPLLVLFGGVAVLAGYKFVRVLFGIRQVQGVRPTYYRVRNFFRNKRR